MLLMAFGGGPCGKREAFSSRKAEGGGFPVGRGEGPVGNRALCGFPWEGPSFPSGNPRPSRDRSRGGLGGMSLWISHPSAPLPSMPLPQFQVSWTFKGVLEVTVAYKLLAQESQVSWRPRGQRATSSADRR